MTGFVTDVGGVVPALGWTLLHFLWQGGMIAVLLWVFLRAVRSPSIRHNLAVTALLAMAAAPIVTFCIIRGGAPDLVLATRAPDWFFLGLGWQAWLVAIWLVGVVGFAARTLGGLWLVERMRRDAIALPPLWQTRCRALHLRMATVLPVAFLQSTRIGAPLVTGWLRPAVLIPVAALMSLPTDQLEALILHELAHVRRLDAFANLLQAIVETALFYHPAVWWVSRRIRIEREHCCDDLAVAVTRDPAIYVRALQAIDGLKAAPAVALAANSGQLKTRAERLLAGRPKPPAFASIAALFVLFAWVGFFGDSFKVQASPAPQAAKAPVNATSPTKSDSQSDRLAPLVDNQPGPPNRSDAQNDGSSGQSSGGGGLASAKPASGSHSSQPLETMSGQEIQSATKALGPMPPATDAAGQAAWRIRRYDLTIASDRQLAKGIEPAIKSSQENLNTFDSKSVDDPSRVRALASLDMFSSMQTYSEMHLQAAEQAKKAVAHAEAVRLAVVAGKRRTSDLEAAKAKVVEAEKIVKAADEARMAKINASTSASLAIVDRAGNDAEGLLSDNTISEASAAKTDGNSAAAISAAASLQLQLRQLQAKAVVSLKKVNEAREGARLEGVAYVAVRDAVAVGQRPASDLVGAADALKAVQEKMYDALDESEDLSRQSTELLNKQNIARIPQINTEIATTTSLIEKLEREPKDATPDHLQDAQGFLKHQREFLEFLKVDLARASKPRSAPSFAPRPVLPVLPE